MRSRFKFGAYILAVLATMFTIMACGALLVIVWVPIPIGFYIVVNVFCILVWLWLVYGEMRTKAIRVEIGYDSFKVKGYLGFGPEKTYYFNDAEGYKLAILPASGGMEYEYLYIMIGGKKMIKLSQFYHKNYAELKGAIAAAKIKYLGEEDFSYARELKEIFV